jgi:hypothetical protein
VSLFSCKDTTQLLSEALDHDLAAGQRLSARLHLLLCGPCSRFRRHLLLLRDAARNFDSAPQEGQLPATARNRILQVLREEGNRQ